LRSRIVCEANSSPHPQETVTWGWQTSCLAVVSTLVIIALIGIAASMLTYALGIVMSPHTLQMLSYQGVAVADAIVVLGFIRFVPLSNAAAIGFRPVSWFVLAAVPAVVISWIALGDAAIAVLHSLFTTTAFSLYQIQSFGSAPVGWRWLIVVLIGAGEIPILEEALFRGILYAGVRESLSQRLERRYSICGAALISSAIFVVMHFSVSSIPMIFVGGIILSLTYELSGSLLPGVAVHCVYNFVMFASGAIYLAPVHL
jgi:uncharacterized protein